MSNVTQVTNHVPHVHVLPKPFVLRPGASFTPSSLLQRLFLLPTLNPLPSTGCPQKKVDRGALGPNFVPTLSAGIFRDVRFHLFGHFLPLGFRFSQANSTEPARVNSLFFLFIFSLQVRWSVGGPWGSVGSVGGLLGSSGPTLGSVPAPSFGVLHPLSPSPQTNKKSAKKTREPSFGSTSS